ncbi:MAG: acetyl-CoA C-acyltransferase [Wenzhouxiangellaceae bacterium]
MNPREVVLVSPLRTAIGTYAGSLKQIEATKLGSTVIEAVLSRSGLDPNKVDTVVMGNVIQAGNRMNPARQAAIGGGVPISVPAMTVNRVCGSGAQAIASVAAEIALGQIDCAIAGGMENMDRAPYLMHEGRWGARMGDVKLLDSMLYDGLHDAFSGEHSGWHTEDLVEKYSISRADQDAWAARSQQRFSKAQENGDFNDEIVPVELRSRKGSTHFERDEHNRPETTLESLAGLRPVFRKDGTITAGNAPGLNTAAAGMIVAERSWAEKNGLEPVARLVGYDLAAVEPGLFGIGPVPAVKRLLKRVGWKAGDIERYEINEAFAAITLAVLRQLGLEEEQVNRDGGAIAHGHPIGATGAVLTTRILHAMQRSGDRRGIVTMCIGGGQGAAGLIEIY